ncbi:hypothetical protein [Leifsonia shinshuensis]|uniref:hypothetical protein n=1 Tax=Leifsonia TaxID=110932 RepID=UPI002860F0E3|nr:hypothetical protein [Leifsonia shinshuensis]MDR6972956.1 FixJ family two-component response regulator [Leifsonia shinshuensis]
MNWTADDIAAALGDLAEALSTAPTAEQVARLTAQLSRRERAVLALFFERLADLESGSEALAS